MKKVLVVLGVICGLVITGSVSAYFLYLAPISQQNDIFTLKEKCTKYLQKEKSKYDEKYFDLEGIFYSKNLKSCIAKWFWGDGITARNFYIDALTGENINDIPTIHEQATIYYSKSIDIDELNKRANKYEDFLQLIK